MKKLMMVLAVALAALANAEIVTRDVTFPADEIPATNPRIERSGGVVTHIEVFAPFEIAEDGSAKTKVAETDVDMDALAAADWVRQARQALGVNVKTYSKLRCVTVLKRAGVWPQVKAWIEANDLYDEYLAAQDFADDNEYFRQGKAALQAALGLTDEQVDAILAECVKE